MSMHNRIVAYLNTSEENFAYHSLQPASCITKITFLCFIKILATSLPPKVSFMNDTGYIRYFHELITKFC